MRMTRIPNFRAKYTRKIGKGVLISNQGAKLILKNKTGRYHVTNNTTRYNTSRNNDVTVTLLKKMLQDRDSHIKDLESQVKNISESHKHLEKLLDQQQQLQLSGQDQNRRLRGQIKRLKAISGPFDKSTEGNTNSAVKPKNQANKSKPGFWSRLFGNY